MLSPVAVPRFTGRDAELAVLTGVLANPGAMVLLEGELGIGKSRLVSEYLATAAGRAVVASCPPFRQPQTLGPVVEALRSAAGDLAAAELSGLAGALRPLFPEWLDVLPPALEPAEDATASRGRLFRALAELLSCLDVGLLVVEDAHWADEATLEFLIFLASRAPAEVATPSLLVTVRSEDVPAGSLLPRLARFAAGRGGLRLPLGPLAAADTAGIVWSMLGTDQVTAGFTAFLHEQTGGVPLAVEESVRLLTARADLTRRDGHWVRRRLAKLAVPPTIRDAILERSARLTADAQQVLSAAAVLAEPAREDVIAAVAGTSADDARAGVSEALGCALLADDERGLVSFRHALACRAVYEAIPGPDRRLLHRRAGEVLAELPAPAATLARHFGEARDTERWQHHCERAAELALAVGDQATSATLLAGLIIGAGLSPAETARVMDKIVLLALPDESQLRELAAALRGIFSGGGLGPGEEPELRFQLGRLLLTMNEADGSRAELEQAVSGLPPGSLHAARAMMLLGWPQGSGRSAREHLRWLQRAEIPTGNVPPVERLRLAIDRASALLLLGDEAGWTQAAEIPWRPRTPSERLQITRAHGNFGESAMLWGRYAEARRSLKHAGRLADRYGYAHLQESGAADLAHLDWLTGRWPGLAERVTALASDEGARAAVRLEAMLLGGLLAAASGDNARAIEDLERYAAGIRERGDVQYLMEPSAALARIHLAAGEASAALRATDEPVALVTRKETWLWAADLVPARAAALVAAGMAEEAASLVDAFSSGVRGRAAPALQASMIVCRAVLADSRGEHADAGLLFGRAAAAWQALPRPYDSLLATESQARSLLADGHRKLGQRLLSHAADRLRQLGASGDAARVRETLDELGTDLREGAPPGEPEMAAAQETPAAVGPGAPSRSGRGRPSYGDRLSPRELEVVRLVADGQSNREIAETLVLSRQTVAGHLQSAMRKLHVSSRTALAVTAIESRLV